MTEYLHRLRAELEGEFYYDDLHRMLYATDGSIYRERPLAVAFPKTEDDIRRLILFAREHQTSLIPRTAGTSLAGQCVGRGIVVDVSRHFTRILDVDPVAGMVRVQPGVIRDELNAFLRPYGLFFGPNTSTANRAMIGGMVGNNSCGTTSIVYGTTRDHVRELRTLLSDGSAAVFRALSPVDYRDKLNLDTLEGALYRQIDSELRKPDVQQAIRKHFPKPEIHRRNTGYAVDLLLESGIFTEGGPDFNFCSLLSGSEGTLAFTTEIVLHVDPLPDPEDVVVCPHFASINESMRAVLVAMAHDPFACELMDKLILDCTRDNITQQRNRFFLEGDPAAVLMVEFRGKTRAEAEGRADAFVAALRAAGLGYAYPVVAAPDSKRVWALRAAGFGVLSNVKGDAKPIEFVEDTAVDVQDLPGYIEEFSRLMDEFGQDRVVYYAHAGAGELHLRPSVNLKTSQGVRLLRAIAEASARLVKKYRGSLSGEHGDGRVRGEFIPLVLGDDNYQLLRRIKETWDPRHILNPGKIVDAPPMDQSLRYPVDEEAPRFDTAFDYSEVGGLLRMAEKCSGSGDCRKLHFVSGGVMCPSYMATREEKNTTRGRANALREVLTRNARENPFDHPALDEAMDLCLSCKGCTAECPSNVDMATLKAEYLHQKYRTTGIPFRSRVIANIGRLNGWGMAWPGLSNFFLSNTLTAGLMKRVLGVAPRRSLPTLHAVSLRQWYRREGRRLTPTAPAKGKVWFFCDEFTNYNDTATGIRAIHLLNRLGYEVGMVNHAGSGRAHISKGLLDEARRMAVANVQTFSPVVSADAPLLGVEPSAIIGFRDEYPRLVPESLRETARALGRHALMIEEFLWQEAEKGRIDASAFTREPKHILLHGHCHQKALSSVDFSAWVLALPEHYTVEVIPSGCCGMAGSFGYEKEHYDLSMKVGELVLFPAVRQAAPDTLVAAPGTSCRHQILDGAGRQALHPVDILWEAVQ